MLVLSGMPPPRKQPITRDDQARSMKWRILSLLCLLALTSCSDDAFDTGAGLLGHTGEPTQAELGLRLIPPGIELELTGLSATETQSIGRGSYLGSGLAVRGAGYVARLPIWTSPFFRLLRERAVSCCVRVQVIGEWIRIVVAVVRYCGIPHKNCCRRAPGERCNSV